MPDAIVRPYRREDRPAVRRISVATAFMGSPADLFFADYEILADYLTSYFTDYEPASSFVAEVDGRVAGYLAGSKNERALGRIFLFNILARLFFKAVLRGTFFNKKNAAFVFYCLRSYFKGELQVPDFSKDYPATLHINVCEGFRGQGVGAKLIDAYLQYLASQKVKGVHMSTMSEEAVFFFKRLGFRVLCRRSRSYFRCLLGKDIIVTTLGKRMKLS
jgi:GNAT superfamily N-acetyltransferase